MLLIETSTERAVIAGSRGQDLLFHVELPFGLRSAALVMPELQQAFGNADLDLGAFDRIVVGSGPGSYTGIRVGVSVAKALSYSRKIPLVGISALYGLIPQDDGPYCAMIDARIGGAYFLRGERTGDRVVYQGEPDVGGIEDVAQMVANVPTIVTAHAGDLKKRLDDEQGTRWSWIERAPDAQQMMDRASTAEPSKEASIEILYLRKTQAEIEREQC